MRAEYTRTIEPARALAAETLTLKRTLSDLVNQALRPDPGGDCPAMANRPAPHAHRAAHNLICPGAGANLCRISAVGGSLEVNWT